MKQLPEARNFGTEIQLKTFKKLDCIKFTKKKLTLNKLQKIP